MDVAKSVAKQIETLRKEEQAHKNAKQSFEKEKQRLKLNLEYKFSTFYDRVEGYTTPGEFLKQNKIDNSYLYGETEISLFYRTPDGDLDYDFLTAILDVNNRRSYVFQVAYNGKNFYWEYDNDELTDEKFDSLMSEIIFEN